MIQSAAFVIFLILIIIIKQIISFYNNKKYINEYNKLISKYKHGTLGVGIYQPKFKIGQVCILVISENDIIIECKLIKGLTVFASFRDVKDIIGLNAIDAKRLTNTQAIKSAIDHALVEEGRKVKPITS